MIAFVFVTPMAWVIGNSFRRPAEIFANLNPVSWKTFIPVEGMTLDNYLQALGVGDVARGLGFSLDRALFISLATAVVVQNAVQWTRFVRVFGFRR